MHNYSRRMIKSFKHNGHLHRTWLENWLVPNEYLHPSHASESMFVLINDRTRIRESNGDEWVSGTPGVSFFIPKRWYNIVALIEGSGVRYYCNIASPMYCYEDVITYIDYDLDVVVMPNREYHIVDKDEYEQHKVHYQYSTKVDMMVKEGLSHLLQRINKQAPPFQDDIVRQYYTMWKQHRSKE